MTGPRNLAINSRRTNERIANLRRLVAELQQRALRRSDIQALLGIGESGARAYIKELRPLLEVLPSADHYHDQHTFKLTDDAARVADFLANPSSVRESAPASKTKLAVANRSGRHFHILRDDSPYHVKVGRVRIPQHDPILAALFGLVQPEQQP